MLLSLEHCRMLTDILEWRRDVRHFKKDAIDPAVLTTIEASVDCAPSVGNSRPWRMVRIADVRRRRAVADDFEAENRRAARIYDDRPRRQYAALKLAGLREAPVHYAVFTEPDPDEGRGLGRQTMPETLAYSTVMAIHTMWLTARAHNVGVGWVSILDPARMNRLLNLPDHGLFTAYLCVGYARDHAAKPELHRRKWQENHATVWIDR